MNGYQMIGWISEGPCDKYTQLVMSDGSGTKEGVELDLMSGSEPLKF
jgi:hypothetical protein